MTTRTEVLAPAPADGTHRSPRSGRRRRGLAQRQRPLWMLAPGGLLTAGRHRGAAAGGALHLAARPRPVHAPAVGTRAVHRAGQLRRGAERLRRCRTRSGSSLAYAAIVTVVALPIGVAAALATQNRFPGRARGPLGVPDPVRAAGVRGRHRLADHPAADRRRRPHAGTPRLPPRAVAQRTAELLGAGHRADLDLLAADLPAGAVRAAGGRPDVHEAAALDGAGWWAKLRRVVPRTCAARSPWRWSSRSCTTSTASPCRSCCSACRARTTSRCCRC